MKNKIIKGVSILLLANILGKIFGMIYRIPLTNILGAEGMGIYQMIFPAYSFCIILVQGGMLSALSKIVAESRAEKKYDSIDSYFKQTFIISLIFASIFSLVFILFGKSISILQGNEKAYLGYMGMSIAVFFACLSSPFKGYFQGYENMTPTAISIIIEQSFKLLLGIVLSIILIEKGVVMGVFGASIGLGLAEMLSFIFLTIFYMVDKKNRPKSKYKKRSDLKTLFKLSIPFTLTSLVNPLVNFIESLFVVNILSTYLPTKISTSLYGIQTGMVNPIINFPIVLTSCLSVALLPSLSYKIKANENLSPIINKSYKYIWIFVIAVTFGYFAISKTVLSILFPRIMIDYENISSSLFLISSLSIIFLSFGQISSSIMQASGKIYIPVVNLTIASIIKIGLAIFLLYNKQFSILGLAIANTLGYGIYALLNIISVKDIYDFNIGFKNVFIPLVVSFLMFLICKSTLILFENINILLGLVFSILFALLFYFTVLFVLGIITKDEILNLKEKKDKI